MYVNTIKSIKSFDDKAISVHDSHKHVVREIEKKVGSGYVWGFQQKAERERRELISLPFYIYER